jgi:hypothetical protein
MNSQPANTCPVSYPDARIDQVLDALRTTGPPTGLEQRIAARLAQAAEVRSQSAPASSSYTTVILNAVKDPCSSLAPAKFYSAAALTVAIALTTFTIVHHDDAQANFNSHSNPIAQSQTTTPSLNVAELQSRHTTPRSNPHLAAEDFSAAATTQGPRPFTVSTPLETAGLSLPPSAQDPEAIALAETLAPSRPAPPMPLTAQEKLIQAATRPGQPIQLAELDLARAPNLRAAAEARQTASIDRYVRSLLAPFVVADALQPTAISQPQEAPTSAPAEPTSNPTN